MGILVVVAFAVLVGLVLWWQYKQAQARRDRLQQYALANRWTFVPRDDSQCTRWQRPPFNEGFDRRATSVMWGKFRNHDMLAFDYTYKTETRDAEGRRSTQTHNYRIAAIALPTWLPSLEVGPENVLTRLGTVVGVHDIELESEDFNRRYRVHADDRKFAYDVLSARVIERLMTFPTYHWRIDGNSIVSWDTGRTDVSDLIPRLNALAVVVEGVPDFVWRDNGLAPTPPGGTS